jgi:hypothetical protein
MQVRRKGRDDGRVRWQYLGIVGGARDSTIIGILCSLLVESFPVSFPPVDLEFA